jgi:hypothetical protein
MMIISVMVDVEMILIAVVIIAEQGGAEILHVGSNYETLSHAVFSHIGACDTIGYTLVAQVIPPK